MVDVNKLPYQVSKFSSLIDQSRIYVDKTDLVAQLVLGVGPVLLSRPRRFGKSTLVSTFEELFSHGLRDLKGLRLRSKIYGRIKPIKFYILISQLSERMWQRLLLRISYLRI